MMTCHKWISFYSSPSPCSPLPFLRFHQRSISFFIHLLITDNQVSILTVLLTQAGLGAAHLIKSLLYSSLSGLHLSVCAHYPHVFCSPIRQLR